MSLVGGDKARLIRSPYGLAMAQPIELDNRNGIGRGRIPLQFQRAWIIVKKQVRFGTRLYLYTGTWLALA